MRSLMRVCALAIDTIAVIQTVQPNNRLPIYPVNPARFRQRCGPCSGESWPYLDTARSSGAALQEVS